MASPASLTWPALPAQLILASIASPAQQASPASTTNTPQPTSLERGTAAGGVALKNKSAAVRSAPPGGVLGRRLSKNLD